MSQRPSTSFRNMDGLKPARIPQDKQAEAGESLIGKSAHQRSASDYQAVEKSHPAKRHQQNNGNDLATYDNDDDDQGILGEVELEDTQPFEQLGDQDYRLGVPSFALCFS